MNVIWDGLSVIQENWLLVIGILSLVLLGQYLIYSVMNLVFGDQLTAEEYYSLGLAGWLLPIALISLLWYVWETFRLPQFSALILVVPLLILAVMEFTRIKLRTTRISRATLLGLLLLFFISIPLRLAFVSKAIMPLYFDSARHFTIIESLRGNIDPSTAGISFQWLSTDYYHVGFHFVAAFLASSLGAETPKTMLILGQMILVAMPLSLFYIIRRATDSNSAGIFTVLVAGFGWSMPAYAVNWGKYPALTSLALIPFVVGVAYLAFEHSKTLSPGKKWILYAMLGLGILISVFFHSRSLVLIGISALAWVTARWWKNLPALPRSLVLYALILGILMGIVFIQTREILSPLFEPYGSKGFLVTLTIILLAIFAQKTFPQLAFANILGIFLLLCCLFLPTPNFISRVANLTLLDRTFVEMVLYLPLSLLGGLGLAGLQRGLALQPVQLGRVANLGSRHVGVLFIGLILGNAFLTIDPYPSDCCTIVGRDDLAAIEWMEENLPFDARIAISSTELIVQSSGLVQGYSPADAGAWITPLTGRVTVPLPYYTNLSREKQFNSLCDMSIDYIYIGAIGLSFHAPRLRDQPDWYTPLFSMPRAEVYQVIGCKSIEG